MSLREDREVLGVLLFVQFWSMRDLGIEVDHIAGSQMIHLLPDHVRHLAFQQVYELLSAVIAQPEPIVLTLDGYNHRLHHTPLPARGKQLIHIMCGTAPPLHFLPFRFWKINS